MLGGTVPLKAPQIKSCLSAIRDAVPKETRLHILGFAKANEIESFAPLGITSFDTTSPLLRAFKDAKANYYLPAGDGRLAYYTAIRVPQALENTKLLRLVKRGVLSQEDLVSMERAALDSLRAYDREECSLEETLEAVGVRGPSDARRDTRRSAGLEQRRGPKGAVSPDPYRSPLAAVFLRHLQGDPH